MPEQLHPVMTEHRPGLEGMTDADLGKIRVQDIFPMTGALHPARHNVFRRALAGCDVLACRRVAGDDREAVPAVRPRMRKRLRQFFCTYGCSIHERL